MVPTVLDAARASSRRPRSGASPSRRSRASASRTPSTTPTPPSDHHTQYFEMLGHRAIYHDGWRAVCPWPGPSFTEAGIGFGQPISADKLSELDADGLGALPRRRGLRREPQRRGRAPRQAHRADRHVVRRGRQVRRPARRRQRPRSAWSPRSRRSAAPRDRYIYQPGHPVDAVLRRPAGAQPAAQHHRDASRSPRAAPRASCSARAPRPAATRCSSRTAGCTTSTTTSAASLHRVSSPEPVPAGAHELRFEFEPTGAAGPGQRARGARAAAALRRRDARRRGRGPGDHAVLAQPRRPHLRRQPRLAGDPGLPVAVPVHRHPAHA